MLTSINPKLPMRNKTVTRDFEIQEYIASKDKLGATRLF